MTAREAWHRFRNLAVWQHLSKGRAVIDRVYS